MRARPWWRRMVEMPALRPALVSAVAAVALLTVVRPRSGEISSPSRGEQALTPDPSCVRARNLEIVARQRGRFGIVLVADLSREEALRLADAAAAAIAPHSV